jgi:hypothetical protein
MDRFFSALTVKAREGAVVRGIVFAVSKDDILGKFLEQDAKCALTGIEMDWSEAGGTTGRGKRSKLKPSVDRIDSQGNYTVNNVQMVLSVVNFMKGDLTTDQFVSLCDHVSSHRLLGSL